MPYDPRVPIIVYELPEDNHAPDVYENYAKPSDLHVYNSAVCV